MHRKIGQLLSEIVPLSTHDLEDILQEQKATRQRFGDAALSLGMVQPEHVWQAWIKQVDDDAALIDLNEVGVDTCFLHMIPLDLVRRWNVLPVRCSPQAVLIACETLPDDDTRSRIQTYLGSAHPVYVVTRPGQVTDAINHHLQPNLTRTAAA